MAEARLFVGIDVGTGGVRALAVSGLGEVAGQAAVAFQGTVPSARADWHEQPAEAWWRAVCEATRTLVAKLKTAGRAPDRLAAVAVDGTSGTLVALDATGQPLRPAILYNDGRAEEEAEELNALAGEFCQKLGYRFAPSFSLAKVLWLENHEPAIFEKTAILAHQTDYVVGRLSGEYGVSDYSNALKTGYDLVDECWPGWLTGLSSVVSRLPRVVAPGTPVGRVSAQGAENTGLPEGLAVISGASDGTAAALASGLARPGDYNSTLGTTLVFKGISSRLCRHPDGLIYCHKLPGGLWLPGAASNTGCEWMGRWFGELDPAEMDRMAGPRLPSRYIAYPLARRGERFPRLCPEAEGFCEPQADDVVDRYAACIQGVAMVERLGYAVLDEAIGTRGGEVLSTGGGSRSDLWMQCRADVTGRVVHRPACGESAFGAAVLAAAGSHYGSVGEAVGAMVRRERSFAPRQGIGDRYGELYEQFLDEWKARGYL